MKSPGVTIVGLGPGDIQSLTLEAWSVLMESEEVYLRTSQHPVVPSLPRHLKIHSFDGVYVQADNFEEVYDRIVSALLELGAGFFGVENLFPGRVREPDPEGGVTRVELPGGQSIAVPLARECAVGRGVTVAVRAEDVIVSRSLPQGLSARNLYEVSITALSRTGADVTLRCAPAAGAPEWVVRVTPAAVASLGLDAGQGVFLAVKSHSVRLV